MSRVFGEGPDGSESSLIFGLHRVCVKTPLQKIPEPGSGEPAFSFVPTSTSILPNPRKCPSLKGFRFFFFLTLTSARCYMVFPRLGLFSLRCQITLTRTSFGNRE